MKNRLEQTLNLPNSVYVAQCQGFCKIGISDNPRDRVAAMQTGNPFPISLLAVIPTDNPEALEEELHADLARFRHRGEWFKLPQQKLEWLLTLSDSAIQQLCHSFEARQEPDYPLPVVLPARKRRMPRIPWPEQDPVCLPVPD